MRKIGFAPPTPEVQYLPAIFRRIESGDLRIPAFQRSFVWTEAQVLELLQSIYKGYPVGSLLFWKVDSPQLQILVGNDATFPTVEEQYPLSFVLDGMQRLKTLYGTFKLQNLEKPSQANVIFDLRTEAFSHYKNGGLPEAHIHLSSLFSPKKLLDTQRLLADLPDADELIDRSIALHSIFQEYQIPTVTITGREVSEVVEIFERINSTGISLNAIDFMRALTWSTEFDLNQALSSLKEELQPSRFRFKLETLAKTLAVILNRAPTPEDMLTLRTVSAAELHEAVEKSRDALRHVIRFLEERFFILSSDYVPYEGQTLVLAKLFATNPNPSDEILRTAQKWFWSISFSEGLRGKPANVVTNAINAAERLANGDMEALKFRLKLSSEDLYDRRLIRNKALSAAVASMFAVRQARSLVSGQIIDPKEYMIGFWSGSFEGLIPLHHIREAIGSHIPTPKLFSNMVLVSGDDRIEWDTFTPQRILENLKENVSEGDVGQILASQFIDQVGQQHLVSGRYKDFLRHRAITMFEFASALSQDEVTEGII